MQLIIKYVCAIIIVMGVMGVFIMSLAKEAPKSKSSAEKIGNCLLVVDEYTYIDGQCNSYAAPDAVHVSKDNYSATVQFVDGDKAEGFWSGPFQYDHDSQPLGSLIRSGDCWINKQARVCRYGYRHLTIGQCKLDIKGHTYIDGPCPIETYRPSGSFYMNDTCDANSKFSASVTVGSSSGVAKWSGDPPKSNQPASLGPVQRKGACWVNEVAQICAYRAPRGPVEGRLDRPEKPEQPEDCKAQTYFLPIGEDWSSLQSDMFEPDASCLLTFQGRNYASGKCHVELRNPGAMVVSGTSKDAGYEALITASRKGTTGAWNGAFGQDGFPVPLGRLTRTGDCWTSGSGFQICVFKPVMTLDCTASQQCKWAFDGQHQLEQK